MLYIILYICICGNWPYYLPPLTYCLLPATCELQLLTGSLISSITGSPTISLIISITCYSLVITI